MTKPANRIPVAAAATLVSRILLAFQNCKSDEDIFALVKKLNKTLKKFSV